MDASAFCPIRLLGHFSLVISFPILFSRILFGKDGCDGVSLTTQVFHLLIFVTRYLDIFLPTPNYISSQYDGTPLTWHQWYLFWYIPSIKAYILVISIGIILAMVYRAIIEHATNKQRALWKEKAVKLSKTLAVYILPTFCLAYRFNYSGLYNYYGGPAPLSNSFFDAMDVMKLNQAQWPEILYSFSHFLAAVGDIPQYRKYYNYLTGRKSHDWWLMSSLFATVNFRHFYITHLIVRSQRIYDLISIVGAIVQIFIFWVFVVVCNTRPKNITRSLPTIDEETPVVKGECGSKEAAALDVKH